MVVRKAASLSPAVSAGQDRSEAGIRMRGSESLLQIENISIRLSWCSFLAKQSGLRTGAHGAHTESETAGEYCR